MASSEPGGIPALNGKLFGSTLSAASSSIVSSTETGGNDGVNGATEGGGKAGVGGNETEGLKGDRCLPSAAILSARIKPVNLALHAAL